MRYRTNQEWIEQLRGDHGPILQGQAHEKLSKYLHKMAYNYLITRQIKANPHCLACLQPEELAALAHDFAQDTLLKLSNKNFALLAQFKGEGRFTSWATSIVVNEAKQELRKSYWEKRGTPPPDKWTADDHEEWWQFKWGETVKEMSPENKVILQELEQDLLACLEKLNSNRRFAFRRRHLEGGRVKDIALEMNKSEGAVSALIFNAKRDLRECLCEAGWDIGVLEIFHE